MTGSAHADQVAEDSHMTLKDYFDAADQRREKERLKKLQQPLRLTWMGGMYYVYRIRRLL